MNSSSGNTTRKFASSLIFIEWNRSMTLFSTNCYMLLFLVSPCNLCEMALLNSSGFEHMYLSGQNTCWRNVRLFPLLFPDLCTTASTYPHTFNSQILNYRNSESYNLNQSVASLHPLFMLCTNFVILFHWCTCFDLVIKYVICYISTMTQIWNKTFQIIQQPRAVLTKY